jgi:hypothetical protein
VKRATWRERNRDAFNGAWRKWYRSNAKRKLAWQTRRRNELRALINEVKATRQCEICGESAPECLHFHHPDPRKKLGDISAATANGWPKKRILAEIAKCQVLCANCHLKLHWNERASSSG